MDQLIGSHEEWRRKRLPAGAHKEQPQGERSSAQSAEAQVRVERVASRTSAAELAFAGSAVALAVRPASVVGPATIMSPFGWRQPELERSQLPAKLTASDGADYDAKEVEEEGDEGCQLNSTSCSVCFDSNSKANCLACFETNCSKARPLVLVRRCVRSEHAPALASTEARGTSRKEAACLASVGQLAAPELRTETKATATTTEQQRQQQQHGTNIAKRNSSRTSASTSTSSSSSNRIMKKQPQGMRASSSSCKRRVYHSKRMSTLVATILILIAYELSQAARHYYYNNHSTKHLSCQRCLPDAVFIRSCSGAAVVAPKANDDVTASLLFGPLDSVGQFHSTANNHNATTTTINSIVAEAQAQAHDNATTTTAATKQNSQQHVMANVLCNSRCNCVILEPLAPSTANLNPGSPSTDPQVSSTSNNHQQQSGGAVVATAASANNASQRKAEQALIAFTEDYSLDYDQSQAPGTTVVADDPGAPDTGDSTATASVPSGNDRTQTAATVSVPVGKPQQPLLDQAPNRQATGGADSVTTSATLLAAASNSTLQQPTQLVASPVDVSGATIAAPAANTSGHAGQAAGGPVGAGAAVSGAAATTTSATTNGQASVVGASSEVSGGNLQLFPLPSPHGGHHAHHLHHHLGAPLGSGGSRDSSGPQLYAQSLYSSQAPKLSYHAHTPYLKSQAVGSNIVAGVGVPVGAVESSLPLGATPGGGQGYPYHHVRASYLAHHLRQLPSVAGTRLGGAVGGRIQGGDFLAHEQVASSLSLVPLRNLDFSGRLRISTTTTATTNSPSAAPSNSVNKNNDTTTTTTTITTNTNSSSSGSDSQQLNWKEFPQLIETIQLLLTEIERVQVQSLTLRNNELQFELWSELYALLALQMRQHLFHLDLSHNSLAKLGITFTGYIEHHLAAHGSWPFSATTTTTMANGNNGQTTTSANGQRPSTAGGNNKSVNTGSQQTAAQSQPTSTTTNLIGGNSAANKLTNKLKVSNRLRHSLLSGGKLYALVQQQRLVSQQQQQQQRQNSTNFTPNNSNNNNNNNNYNYNYNYNGHAAIGLLQPMLIKALDLSHNKLKWLINDQFRALRHVQTIRLDYNRIRYIHQHAFSGLETLRFLNLNFNQLQVIYIEQFQTNYNLLALMLRSNYLAYLRGGSFASLANLKRLDLSKNKLTIVSNNAFVGLESLELLNCSSNQFVHAPSASLHPLTSLRQLDLGDNLIAQLAPGTFFHLPIEELWLSENEQLIAIDRGAFWDLPYLRRLHLNANPMLMSINSQAFVGTQALQAIDVDECQSLDSGARQMLDNITMAATSRLLRHEQQQQQQRQATAEAVLGQQQQTSAPATLPAVNSTTNSSIPLSIREQKQPTPDASTSQITPTMAKHSNGGANNISSGQFEKLAGPGKRSPVVAEGASGLLASQQQQSAAGSQTSSGRAGNRLNYFYYLGIVSLLVVSLKLVFKYTSTSHYLETRRRRRRVYEAKSGVGGECSSGSDLSSMSTSAALENQSTLSNSDESHQMCEQPSSDQSHVIMDASGHQLRRQSESSHPFVQSAGGGEGGTDQEYGELAHDDTSPASACGTRQMEASNVGRADGDIEYGVSALSSSASLAACQSTIDMLAIEQGPSCGEHQETCSGGDGDDAEMSSPARVDSSVAASAITEEPNTTSVIGSEGPTTMLLGACCPDCPARTSVAQVQTAATVASPSRNEPQAGTSHQAACCQEAAAAATESEAHNNSHSQEIESHQQQQQQQSATIDLIHSQLIAAGFDLGHANCAHFYQSLGPALQLADMTNFVNQMDYY